MLDKTGTKELKFGDFRHDLNWVWVEHWKINIDMTTDDQGWTYADKINGSYNKLADSSCCVRKRQWFRQCYRLY